MIITSNKHNIGVYDKDGLTGCGLGLVVYMGTVVSYFHFLLTSQSNIAVLFLNKPFSSLFKYFWVSFYFCRKETKSCGGAVEGREADKVLSLNHSVSPPMGLNYL